MRICQNAIGCSKPAHFKLQPDHTVAQHTTPNNQHTWSQRSIVACASVRFTPNCTTLKTAR